MRNSLCVLVASMVLVCGMAMAAPVEEMQQNDRMTFQTDNVGGAVKKYPLSVIKDLLIALACEDVPNQVCRIEERYSTIPVGGTTAAIVADQLYKSGPGYVRSIQCYGNDNAATAGTIALRDNTVAGAGDTLWSRTILAADYSINGFKADIQAPFAVGLFLDFTTTADVTCMVQYR